MEATTKPNGDGDGDGVDVDHDQIVITQLNIYPIKSCRGITLDSASTNEYGFIYDRQWMVVTQQVIGFTRSFVSQRQKPRLALIQPSIVFLTTSSPSSSSSATHEATAKAPCTVSLSSNEAPSSSSQPDRKVILRLDAPGMPSFDIEVSSEEELIKNDTRQEYKVKLWRETCSVIDEGDEVAAWLSKFLEYPSRLVRMGRAFGRSVDEDHKVAGCHNVTSLTDAYPFLLISEESLAGLNNKIHETEADHAEMEMCRFRPNIVVRGADKPHGEDFWRTLRVVRPAEGTKVLETIATLHVAYPCERCMLPRVNQFTGELGNVEPTRTLRAYRDRAGRQYFGQYLVHEAGGKPLRVGDRLQVVSAAQASNIDTL